MELSRTGTLSTVTNEGWPLGIGARFVVDEQGIPALCLSSKEDDFFSVGARSSFHVQAMDFVFLCSFSYFSVQLVEIVENP